MNPGRIIPRSGCSPAEPASVSSDSIIILCFSWSFNKICWSFTFFSASFFSRPTSSYHPKCVTDAGKCRLLLFLFAVSVLVCIIICIIPRSLVRRINQDTKKPWKPSGLSPKTCHPGPIWLSGNFQEKFSNILRLLIVNAWIHIVI